MTITRFRDLFVTFQFPLSSTTTDWKSAASVFSGRVLSASTIFYDSQSGIANWDSSAWGGLVVHTNVGHIIYHLPMDVQHEARNTTIGNSN
jgi:hypothetical protein